MTQNANLTDNRALLRKADLALSDLTTDGGLLQPAQAIKFLRLLILESKLLGMATVTPMRSPKQLVENIRFGSRILRAGSEATALSSGDRAKVDLGKVELDAQLFKAEVRLDNEVLEDSIERNQLRQTIMELMGEAIARDMDEVIVQGDTTSSDAFLAKFDGILKQSVSNLVDAGGDTTNKDILNDAIKTLPHEFLRDRKNLRFLTSINSEQDYRDSLAERATIGGDRYLTENVPVQYSGIPLEAIPLFPENLGSGNNYTNMILTDPKNVNVGIWRNIRLETDKDVSAGVLIIVATLRFDVKYAYEPATVKIQNVKVSA